MLQIQVQVFDFDMPYSIANARIYGNLMILVCNVTEELKYFGIKVIKCV